MEGIQLHAFPVGAGGEISLLKVRGYVDATTAPELNKSVTKLLQDGRYQIIVDLSAVNYISSAGWGVFVGEIRGIRENGGDLKIVHMTPDVREVFEMLEFNRILSSYDGMEEVLDDFDLSLGYDLTKSIARSAATDTTQTDVQSSMNIEPVRRKKTAPVNPPAKQGGNRHSEQKVHTDFLAERKQDVINLPLPEKIRKVVLENPNSGAWIIKKTLNSPRFGYVNVGLFKLRSILKSYNLETKKKRYRYYRSR